MKSFLAFIGGLTLLALSGPIGFEFAIYREVGSGYVSRIACERRQVFFEKHDPTTREGAIAFKERWSDVMYATRLEFFVPLCTAALRDPFPVPKFKALPTEPRLAVEEAPNAGGAPIE